MYFTENKKGKRKDIDSTNKYIYTIIFFSLTSIITDVNECVNTSVCNTSCINTPGSFWCLCEAGWTGKHCDQGNLSILFVELNLSLWLTYRIEYIFVVVFVQERFVPFIKIFVFVDIDECATGIHNPFPDNGTCINTNGSFWYNCTTCWEGVPYSYRKYNIPAIIVSKHLT